MTTNDVSLLTFSYTLKDKNINNYVSMPSFRLLQIIGYWVLE